MTHKSGTAAASDGVSIHYTLHTSDNPQARPLVLVHTLGMDESVWDAAVAGLQSQCAILTYDCRGHGRSSKPKGPYTLERFALDIGDVMSAVGWEAAHLAGASMGGSMALQFALMQPSRVLSLGLVDTTAWFGEDAPSQWDERARAAEVKGMASLIDFQLARWFSDEYRQAHPEVMRRCSDIFVRNDTAAYAATCRMLGQFDLRPRLKEIHAPAAVIVGENDLGTSPEMARTIASGIEGASLHIIPHARHFTFIESADAVVEILADLIKTAEAQAASGRKR